MGDRSSSFRRQVYFWTGTLFLCVLLLWLFSSILLPFVLGMVIAYLLDPVADWFERRGFSRLMATIIILFLFISSFVAILLIVVPVISSQIANFAKRVPDYLDRLQDLAPSESEKARQEVSYRAAPSPRLLWHRSR